MISPRKTEIEAVAKILDSDEYADARAMSRAIVAAVAAALLERELYAVQAVGEPIAWGPFWTPNEAERTWPKVSHGKPGRIVIVKPWQDRGAEATGCKCGHQKAQHVASKTGKAQDCALPSCKCPTYQGV